MSEDLFQERKLAVMQLRRGWTMEKVATDLDRSVGWVSKWKKRYEEKGVQGLKNETRTPKNHGTEIDGAIKEAIIKARLELEMEAEMGIGLKYIGGQAIRTRLKHDQINPLPSIATIERVLRSASLTKRRPKVIEPKVDYPHLAVSQPHQLTQVDIVPHFLQGGQRIACFNAIDVVSRYVTGAALAQKRSQDAVKFLAQMSQKMGVSEYTQVDNENCFSGGTHPYLFGKVTRWALAVGTQLVFSPVRHPQSNGFIERFHQDYNTHVWQDTYLSDLHDVNQKGAIFFDRYCQRECHSKLQGRTPHFWHHQQPPRQPPPALTLSEDKPPLYAGRIHFIRRVTPNGTVRLLNSDWHVPQFDLTKGVWVTIELQSSQATLSIFDTAPDVHPRQCLASYPFPVHETILPPLSPLPVVSTTATSASEPQLLALSQIMPLPASIQENPYSSFHFTFTDPDKRLEPYPIFLDNSTYTPIIFTIY